MFHNSIYPSIVSTRIRNSMHDASHHQLFLMFT